MKKLALIAALALAFSAQAQTTEPAPAAAAPEAKVSESWFPSPIALPGYTWGSLQFPASVIKGIPESNDLIFSGRTEQGADWFKFGSNKEFTFNTFVAMSYSADHEGLPYNNYVRPQVGMQIRHSWANGGSGTLGVAYQWEDRYRGTSYGGIDSPKSGNGVVVYYNYYGSWDLKNRGN